VVDAKDAPIYRLDENGAGRANKTTSQLQGPETKGSPDSTTIKGREVAQQEVEISIQTGERSSVWLSPFSSLRNYVCLFPFSELFIKIVL
jgi:hypothetical protein